MASSADREPMPTHARERVRIVPAETPWSGECIGRQHARSLLSDCSLSHSTGRAGLLSLAGASMVPIQHSQGDRATSYLSSSPRSILPACEMLSS